MSREKERGKGNCPNCPREKEKLSERKRKRGNCPQEKEEERKLSKRKRKRGNCPRERGKENCPDDRKKRKLSEREREREREREKLSVKSMRRNEKRADTRNLTSAARLQPIRESFWPAHAEANPELSRTVRGMATKPTREKR